MCIFMSMYFGNIYSLKKTDSSLYTLPVGLFQKTLGICFEKRTLDFIFGCNLNGGLSTKE